MISCTGDDLSDVDGTAPDEITGLSLVAPGATFPELVVTAGGAA